MNNAQYDSRHQLREIITMTQPTQSITQTGQQSTAPTPKEHVVLAGETVEQIAKNYDVPAKYLRQLNKLSGPIQPHQKLRIPMMRAAAASAPRLVTSAKTMPASTAPSPAGTTPGGTK
ncbi:MAG: LysM peptidoglycan-binding domain-containing protein [Verrucomicrobiia bacterium]